MGKELKIKKDKTAIFYNIDALVGPVIRCRFNGQFETARITLSYDPLKIDDPTDMSLFYFNKNLSTFIRIESTLDLVNCTVTGTTPCLDRFVIFNVSEWDGTWR